MFRNGVVKDCCFGRRVYLLCLRMDSRGEAGLYIDNQILIWTSKFRPSLIDWGDLHGLKIPKSQSNFKICVWFQLWKVKTPPKTVRSAFHSIVKLLYYPPLKYLLTWIVPWELGEKLATNIQNFEIILNQTGGADTLNVWRDPEWTQKWWCRRFPHNRHHQHHQNY